MRMNHKTLFCAMLAILGGIFNASANTTPFSQYGQIQNVQTYSSNPFWNPNGPYNQRMPQVIYATGPDINTGDCQRVVSSLVANLCSTMNNCANTSIADVRPTLMLQLSRLPGHNYATACSGWIDGEFDAYIKLTGTVGINPNTAFPTATTPNPNTNSQPTINNPFEKPMPEWKQDMIDRSNELQDLMAYSDVPTAELVKMDFPTTVNDLSFVERTNQKVDSYAPFKGAKTYQTLDIEDYETYMSRTNSTTTTTKQNPKKTTPELADNQLPSIENEIVFYL